MSFLEFPIRRYQFTLIAFLLLVAVGVSSWLGIARQEDPYFDISAFNITLGYPGADPQDVEQRIIKPIEDRISELDDVKKTESTAGDGFAQIFIEFYPKIDAQKKYDELVREIDALRSRLPAEMADLRIHKINPGLTNIVQFALLSEDAPYRELEDQARRLKDVLKSVPGVRTAETWAYPLRELRVALDLQRMSELKLSTAQLIQALQSENANVPGGVVDVGARSFSLRTSGSYTSLDQVRDTVVASSAGRIVKVRDVAQVDWNTQQHDYIGRYNGKRAVFVTANQLDGLNIFKTRDAIDTAVTGFARDLPHRIVLEKGFDQADNVAARLHRLGIDFGLAIALVALTLLPLGLRSAAIVMISIPLSLAIGLTIIYFLGYSLNQISIAGFVVALGLLVDDSIVVVENISRFMREGYSRADAALAATRQIFRAVIGCTATLVFAFLPLMLLQGDAGKFIRVLPTTVVATILASLFVAFTIIPFIASRFLPSRQEEHGNRALQWIMGGIHRIYRPLLHRALLRPLRTVIVALSTCLLLIVPLGMYTGFSLFPKADTPHFMVTIETPDGSSLAETDRALRFVEAKLTAMPQVRNYFSNLGGANPKIYYNLMDTPVAMNSAMVFVRLREYNTHDTPRQLDQLRAQLDGYPNARIAVKEFENGPPITAPVSIRVIGPQLNELSKVAADVEKLMRQTPGIRDVVNPVRIARTNLRLQIDPQKAAMLGVPAVELDRAVRMSTAGLPIGKYSDTDGEQYDIIVRTPMQGRATLDALDNVRVPTLTGSALPLSQLATLEFSAAPSTIHRYNRERAVVIDAQVQNGHNVGRVTDEVLQRLDRMTWPRGYSYKPGGELESRQESFGGLQTALVVAILGIIAILVLEFGDFKSTLIVLTVVPFGIAGGIAMLAITGNSISFTATIGFIALIGIEIKNSILLVDFTNRLRSEGTPLDEAIERAGEIRFLPILLTSATAVGGLLPLALQNIALYSPMAWVMIGGLIASTLIARLVTPVMYKLIPPHLEPQASPKAPGVAVTA